jgi:uncharacterized protein YndB with AHSA1/START domain
MSRAVAASTVEDLILTINDEILVKATPEVVFDSLLEQLGPRMGGGENKPMPMVIEAWPGGRWFRDLGNGNGHYWATVQAIKRGNLLEFCGPLMMSQAVVNNVQYRLTPAPEGTLITFHHSAIGVHTEEQTKGLTAGWRQIHERVAQRAEAKK